MSGKKPGAAGESPLKPVCAAGLALALILSWGLVFSAVAWRDTPGGAGGSSFSRELEEYGSFDAPKRVQEGENPEYIERRLSRLQKQVRSAGEQLSVLKRRRVLAFIDRRYIPPYEKAALEAAEAFPFSAPVAAAAAEALVLNGGPLSGPALALLKSYAPRVAQARFQSLELGIRILAGELEDPASALSVPGLENLLSPAAGAAAGLSDFPGSAFPEQLRTAFLVNGFLLRAVKGDIPGASLRLNTLLAQRADSPYARMAAGFFYDHGNPLKAAGLFSRLPGGGDMARAADALVLAGEIPGARNIWLALSRTGGPEEGPPSLRSLYNLAASSASPAEEASWLEQVFSFSPSGGASPGTPMDSVMLFSTLRYTRLLDTARSTAVLEDANMGAYPLLDLELLRRKLDGLSPTQAAAGVWLLLGRNSTDGALHEWAAWYFDHQRLYGETDRLITEALRKGMTGPWLDLHRGLALIREGDTAGGEKILKEAGARTADWRIQANLGRIQEGRRAISAALEYYGAAAALITGSSPRERKAAAQVQMRLSRCLEALDRTGESRRALERALELDPDNLNIRRALRR